MAGSQRTPSRTPSFAGSIDTAGTTPNAALVGASLAFGRPPPRQLPATASASPNAALNAATAAGQRSKTSSPDGKSPRATAAQPPSAGAYRPIARQTTAQSMLQRREMDLSPGTVKRNNTGDRQIRQPAGKPNLWVPPMGRAQSPSPSRSAAVSAASRAPTRPARATPGTGGPKPVAPPKPRRLSGNQRASGNEMVDTPTDDTPIPPTTSLVTMFERKATNTTATPKTVSQPVVSRPSTPLAAKSPAAWPVSNHEPLEDDGSSQEDSYVSASEDTAPSPLPVQKQRSSVVTTLQPPTPTSRRSRLSPSPARAPYTGTAPINIKPSPRSMSSTMTEVSHSPQSAQSITATYHQLYQRRMTPLTTGDDIANAIVASSLASSRAGSPRKLEPPSLPPSRRHGHGLSSRTPSPAKKGMRHTLREAESSESESEDGLHPYGKHKKKRHLRPKHPNKHHEGDRKRWREAVTERERKRYEGVWAANRGLHCFFTSAEMHRFSQAPNGVRAREAREALQDQIANVIAHDLWSRSRLPNHELETVWDLVDSSGVGRLGKEEFVIGMWLIDQRLKGRKLPTRVSPTVWASVKGVEGIKVKKFLG